MKELIDVHVHIAAYDDGFNGCFMSPAYKKGPFAQLVRWKLGLKGSDPKTINESYVSHLLQQVRSSLTVKQVVALALDGVYDANGRLDISKTHMLISNAYVRSLVEKHPNELLFGASINPARRDALDELEKVVEQGACLIKVLPNSQLFDPMAVKHRPFYRALAKHRIPLLSHVGHEFAVTAATQAHSRADILLAALEEGATVIAAHAGSSGLFHQAESYETVKRMVSYSNFYMDLSATTLPNSARMLLHLRNHPEWSQRLLFGTDYPLSAHALPFLGKISVSDQFHAWRTKNTFDKQLAVLNALNIRVSPDATKKVLKL